MPLRPSGRGRWPANPPRPSAPAWMLSWSRGPWRCTAWEAGLPRRLPMETRTFSQWSASLESGAAAAERSSSSGGWGARQPKPRPRPAHAQRTPSPRLAHASPAPRARLPCRRATKAGPLIAACCVAGSTPRTTRGSWRITSPKASLLRSARDAGRNPRSTRQPTFLPATPLRLVRSSGSNTAPET
jgi:hypothetical protein